MIRGKIIRPKQGTKRGTKVRPWVAANLEGQTRQQTRIVLHTIFTNSGTSTNLVPLIKRRYREVVVVELITRDNTSKRLKVNSTTQQETFPIKPTKCIILMNNNKNIWKMREVFFHTNQTSKSKTELIMKTSSRSIWRRRIRIVQDHRWFSIRQAKDKHNWFHLTKINNRQDH